jgi:hypothetical protein
VGREERYRTVISGMEPRRIAVVMLLPRTECHCRNQVIAWAAFVSILPRLSRRTKGLWAIRRVPVRDKVRDKTLPISGQFKRKVKAADKLVLSLGRYFANRQYRQKLNDLLV